MLAVLIGDRAGLSPDIEARMQRAGTYHVLAISGGNIAVLAAIVLAIVGRLGLAPRPRAVVVLGVLALYAAAVVGGASVARATLAAAVYLSARALDLRTPADQRGRRHGRADRRWPRRWPWSTSASG